MTKSKLFQNSEELQDHIQAREEDKGVDCRDGFLV